MIFSLFAGLNVKRKLRKRSNNPVMLAVMKYVNSVFSDTRAGLGMAWKNEPPEVRGRAVAQLLDEIELILRSANALQKNREALVEVVIQNATFRVLNMPSAGIPDVSGLRGKPGISGELNERLQDTLYISQTEIGRELASVISLRAGDDHRSLESIFLVSEWFSGLRAEAFNIVRMGLSDIEDPDWYIPFVAAMCGIKEHQIRLAIGMEPLLSEADVLYFSMFINFVLCGSPNPYSDWKSQPE